jgi:PAS domain S-box-containing protein
MSIQENEVCSLARNVMFPDSGAATELPDTGGREIVRENILAPEIPVGTKFDYSVVIQASRDAMLVADASSGMLVDANPAATALLGRSLEEIRTLHQTDVHSAEDVEAGREAFGGYRYKSGSSMHVLLRADGKRVPVEISASAMRDVSGRELILGIFHDLTERRLAEERLRESEERFRIMADGCPSVMWVTDVEGREVASGMESAATRGQLGRCGDLMPRVVEEFERLKSTLAQVGWL